MKAVQLWGTVEDEHDVLEAMRTDAAEELTALLAGKSIGNDPEVGGEEDEENEEEMTKARGVGGVPHRPTVNSRLTSASWREQHRTVGMQTQPCTCLKLGWR